jgi:hypothetical protein
LQSSKVKPTAKISTLEGNKGGRSGREKAKQQNFSIAKQTRKLARSLDALEENFESFSTAVIVAVSLFLWVPYNVCLHGGLFLPRHISQPS